MGSTPVYGARAEKPLQNADFAMKQTNICRLSGDIIIFSFLVCGHYWPTVFSRAFGTVCRLSVVCLSVCDVLYCGETVRLSEKLSEGANRVATETTAR